MFKIVDVASGAGVLRGCLQKDPKQRIADVQDVRLALAGAFAAAVAPRATGDGVEPAASRRWLPMAGAAALGGLVVALAASAFWPAREAPPVAWFDITTPPGGPPGSGFGSDVDISPDGRYIVYGSGDDAESRLYLRPDGSTGGYSAQGRCAGHWPFLLAGRRSGRLLRSCCTCAEARTRASEGPPKPLSPTLDRGVVGASCGPGRRDRVQLGEQALAGALARWRARASGEPS